MSYGLLNEIKAAIGKEIVVECLAILFICADVLAGKDKVTCRGFEFRQDAEFPTLRESFKSPYADDGIVVDRLYAPSIGLSAARVK